MGCGVNRALRLFVAHAWVSLRLTFGRTYWLPRLTLAVIAGSMLMSVARDFDPTHPVAVLTSFTIGLSCIALLREEVTGRTLPLPMPQAWLIGVGVVTQILVCALVACGFVFLDIAIATALVLGIEPVKGLHSAIPPMPDATELRAAGLMVAGSLPVGLAVVRFGTHIQEPGNAWSNRKWHEVLIPLLGLAAALAASVAVATEFNASALGVNYLKGWLTVACTLTATAAAVHAWVALFPPSNARFRTPKSPTAQFTATLRHSQAIKWAFLCSGALLYSLTDDLSPRRARALQPLVICYSALLPFLSMFLLTSIQATAGQRQFVSLWKWSRSGWTTLPLPRALVQRGLLLDLMLFAATSTGLLHLAALLAELTVTEGAAPSLWMQSLNTYAFYYTWFTGISMPAVLLMFIPRRRFGLGLAATALASMFWSLRSAFGSLWRGVDVGWDLPFIQYGLTLAFWAILAAVAVTQFGSPTGRLLDGTGPTSRLTSTMRRIFGDGGVRVAFGVTGAAFVLFGLTVHRNQIRSSIEEHHGPITAEQTDRLIEDLKRIETVDVLRSTTRTRNAAVALSPYIGLEDGTAADTEPWWKSTPNGKQKGPRGPSWHQVPNEVEVGDLSILTKLMEFDHWESGQIPGTNDPVFGAYERHLRQVEDATYLHLGEPFPNLFHVLNLSKYRLILGLQTGDMIPALTEVRHLARLVHSDETLVNTATAVGILRAERNAYEAAVERKQMDATDWAPVSRDDLDRMTRASVSMGHVLSGGAEPREWQRLTDLAFEPFGLCGAIHDAMLNAMSLPNVSPWPGELFPTQTFALAYRAMESSSCTLPLARHDLHESKQGGFKSSNRLFRNNQWHRILSRDIGENTVLALTVPYLRGHVWLMTRYAHPTLLMYGNSPEEDWRRKRIRTEQ